ncbi:MAG TPA: alkaline phosphatase family protein, partial [Verrucomicrobiota bacterium]|nr:alkaline phosphatase family protein [Verrucomicrobiota bacterium]
LDYNLQRYGTSIDLIKNDLRAIDTIVGDLIRFFKQRSVQVILLSEYGINDSDKPIFLNRVFREKGWIKIKEELGREMLDCGASKAFALSDHQIAHIYVNDKSIISEVKNCIENQPGILLVLDDKLKSDYGIDHQRAGDLIAIPKSDYWFSYYYWFDDKKAPDFAPTVDIHRKPGYDPVELFLQQTPLINLKILFRIAQSKLGFRTLLDIIPLDANLVKGSHGAPPTDKKYYPVIISEKSGLIGKNTIDSTDVYQIIKRAVVEN